MTTQLPTAMQAYVLHHHGGMDALQFHKDWPVPAIGKDDVLIKVGACGLNNTDVNTRTGWYSKSVSGATDEDNVTSEASDDPAWGGAPIKFPRIQGADAVGAVVAVGANASEGLIGKRVMVDCWMRDWDAPLNREKTGYFGSERDGGFAGYTTVDRRNVGVIDSELSDAELATFSCSYTTAEGMLSRAAVAEGDRVLVTGASGGVGSALVQLAKRRGAHVTALSHPDKHDILRDLGADVLLDRAPTDLGQALCDATGQCNVNVVCDVVGGPSWPQFIDVLARGGRYACSGAIAGPMVTLDLRTLYLRDLTLHGSTVIPPHIFKDLVGYIEREEIAPVLAKTYPLSQLKNAQQAFTEKAHVGNIVVVPD
ncbi:Oxidoreductase, zinc-binding dehydrogenase family [Sulfitobacter noctilucicola]|uniref:NADPH:quinone reductase-like Zn-dependent oxidoreductase n=1 Tax=Sulfitobacter noctilucicola TaxID=1342301 RepID=A0A7W6MCF1_9RHOB|nr:zinc-binding dehydrogenase [Sulfitobacter noctilucicola]KIN64167.1 Oxidoreductase, zinc-binding dehydrogenase family [Sulfitobacter noctilucicola]MBB4175521.1 NADPH:quinone reductase-like Zn-dependent oxidoreductase [Sulfitobacter noctilucicola]